MSQLNDTAERTPNERPRTHPSTSERHAILAAKRRRSILSVLAERTGAVDIDALASELAARDRGRDEVDDELVERIVVDLHHAHLPKLDDADVIEYDPTSGLVEPDLPAIAAVRADAVTR